MCTYYQNLEESLSIRTWHLTSVQTIVLVNLSHYNHVADVLALVKTTKI